MGCGRPRRVEGTKTAARCGLGGCSFLVSRIGFGLGEALGDDLGGIGAVGPDRLGYRRGGGMA